MATTTYHRKRSKLHPEDYVNKHTGETLESELGDNGTAFATEATNTFNINSRDFVSFDTKAFHYLMSVLNKPDVSRVFHMSTMVHGDCAVLYHTNNHPHTSETLYTVLDMSHDEFYKMVQRLVDANILAYCICAPIQRRQKVYMLNPYIARKKKVLSCELQTFFSDVTKTKKK